MNRTLVGIVVGLMIATSAIYFVETSEELFEDQDMVKGPFFLLVAVAYIPLLYWIVSKNSRLPVLITMVGTISLLVLYGITRTDMLASVGIEAGSIGHLGITSKVIQIGIVIGSALLLIQSKATHPKIEEVKN